jgi:hypothetical protein
VAAPFELTGDFGGFIRNLLGKRRLLLLTASGEVQLKVPRALRLRLDGRLAIGTPLTVSGFEQDAQGQPHRAVVRVRIPGASGGDACYTCPIQVCTKKNCWRQGGRELWHSFEHELATLDDAPALEKVDCLDRCKHAPNFDCGALEFERVTPERARRFLHDLAALRGA